MSLRHLVATVGALTPLDARARRALSETVRDWEFESASATGTRRLAIDVRGAAAVAMVVLRVGGPALSGSDLFWLVSRVLFPMAAIVVTYGASLGQTRVDLPRLPFEYWPALEIAAFTSSLSLLVFFLPVVILIGTLWPGPRARVPWASAVLAVLLVYAIAAIVAAPWAHQTMTGLHYLTFAIERGTPVSPPASPAGSNAEYVRLLMQAAAAAVASAGMALLAGAGRRRYGCSWIKTLTVAVLAMVSYVVILALPEFLIWRLASPALSRLPVMVWRIVFADVLAGVLAASVAMLICEGAATPAPSGPAGGV